MPRLTLDAGERLPGTLQQLLAPAREEVAVEVHVKACRIGRFRSLLRQLPRPGLPPAVVIDHEVP